MGNNNSFWHEGLDAHLYSGDKVRLKITDYKPTTTFEGQLFYSDIHTQWYVLQNKITGTQPPEGTGKYLYAWQFDPDENGEDDYNELFIKSIISRGSDKVVTTGEYKVAQLSDSAPLRPVESTRINIRKPRVLKVNQNL